ncbi:LOW QUALITY PROTEIN: integrin beta-PS [Procambarus clarkii]|uniref:LOW QUALITY PROTEIN: integrin beta-PS n=1 Tax=Procambarus clarkii TaxID=6728 RepID=UPI003741F484
MRLRGTLLWVVVVGVVWVVVGVVTAQQQQQQQQQQEVEKCHAQRKCVDCIQTPDCMWCSKLKNESEQRVARCQHITADPTTFCDPAHLENITNSVVITQDTPLTVAGNENTGKSAGEADKIVQLRPQRMKLKLRKGVPINVTLTYRQARDYPVDLYYLMDLSNSMKDDKKQLAALGSELAKLMKSLTSQFTLGFGSFVDKVLMPFADTAPDKLEAPCAGCAPPYSFRNDLPLNGDPKQFTIKVEAAPISGNMDSPEGGFDALMQVMVCTEQIGWREQARRIVIFSTDAKFHHAGDGRLAGIVAPNDERCHLNHLHEYSDFNIYDYPSIAQINKIAKEKNINVIFAVSAHELLYKELSGMIETSSYGMLEADSRNVVELVREQYNKISSTMRLTDNSTNSAVSVRYFSSCKGGGAPVLTKECGDIKENDTIDFLLEITASECPTDANSTVVEVKTLQDNLILEIEFECSCNCADPEFVEEDSLACKGAGDLVCGVCACHQGFRGEVCQCSNENSDNSESDTQLCQAKEGEKVCSGLGYCSCGMCVCNDKPVVHGTYCECNSRKCQSGVGSECSGHGTCDCNKCRCEQGYTGDLCQCRDDSACRPQGSQETCSGHGKCDCGKCKCSQQHGVTYTGQYCEDCPTCSAGKCIELRDCVQCQQFNTGKLKDTACPNCTIESVKIDTLDGQVATGARLCTFEDEEGCLFNFTYRYIESSETNPQQYQVFVQKERQCPQPPPVLGIVFGLVAAIVAIGFLTLLIWKLLTTLHDRREYAKFEKERENAQWEAAENPLYKSAKTTFQNPAFAQTK